MNTRKLLVALFALAVLGAGCGVPIDSAAHPLASAQFAPVAVPATTPTTTTTPLTNSERGFYVYFVRRDILSAVSRSDPSATTPPTVAIAIEAINNGPSATEIGEGYSSPFVGAPGAQVSAVSETNGIVTVSLNSDFVTLLLGVSLYEAYGEIVLTLVSPWFPGVKGVKFVFDGLATAALLPNGRVVSGPVGVCDYAAIATASVKARCR